MSVTSDKDAEFNAAIQSALASNPARVQGITFDQRLFWIKRTESLSPRMRLLKGDPKAGFERERTALQFLAGQSVSVPLLAAQGDNFIVLSDAGPTVFSIVLDQNTSKPEREKALAAAASALADLHSKDIAHGRPAIRDIALKDDKVTFLDFENFDPTPASERRKIRDLLVFAHSLYRWSTDHQDEIDQCLAAYRDKQPEIWQAAVNWCSRNRWINVLTRPLQNLKKRGKDFRPVPYLFETFK